MMNKLLIALLGLLVIGCKSHVENEKSPFDGLTALVNQYAENTIKKGNINSLAIAIYKDSLAYQGYYGEIDKGAGNTPNDRTLYEIASISKIFAGSLVAKAVLESKLSLDDDIRLYLNGNYGNLELDGEPVRVRHLVTHTLGFDMPQKMAAVYDKIFSGYYENRVLDYGIDDLLEELKLVQLERIPGTYYDYSNLGPELAAYILEQVYGKSYQELLHGLFEQTGISNTYIQNFEKHKEYLANGYDENNELATFVKNPILGAAAGLIASLPDLANFMKYQLESNDPFINESTRYVFKDGEDDTGYFWDLGRAKKEGFYYSKSGSSNGVQSILLICPDSNYGMIIIMNNQSDDAMNDWVNLYNRIEYDLIEYPKINLWSTVASEFETDVESATKKYNELKTGSDKYFSSSNYLNRVGYSYLANNNALVAINVFQLAISEDPMNADLYDSLGEAYFIAEQYQDAKISYEKSLSLDPGNDNAKEYLTKIKELIQQ